LHLFLARRAVLALIHHTVNDPADLSKNRLRYLNCYGYTRGTRKERPSIDSKHRC
jgi:hypothetical protein